MWRTNWRWLATGLTVAAVGLPSAPPAAAAGPAKAGPADATTVSELIVTATKTVSELTVTAKIKCLNPDSPDSRASRPKVVSSFPAKGAMVRPGLLIVRVTFDQPMTCDGFLLADPPRRDPCPESPQQMLLSFDRRTVRVVCVVEPNAEYGLALSSDPDGRSFVGLSGLPSLPYRIAFSTSGGPTAVSVCDALSEDETTARQIRDRRPMDCSASPPGR